MNNQPTEVHKALGQIENLRRAVLTVQGPNGPTALSGADHDALREAFRVVSGEIDALQKQVFALTPLPNDKQ